jgi:hypothetical protein
MKRYITVVIDGPDFYIGKRHIGSGELGAFVAKFAELNHIQAVEIVGTTSASYGDAVRAVSVIDRNQTPLVRMDVRIYPIGYRTVEIGDRDWFVSFPEPINR